MALSENLEEKGLNGLGFHCLVSARIPTWSARKQVSCSPKYAGWFEMPVSKMWGKRLPCRDSHSNLVDKCWHGNASRALLETIDFD